MKIELCKYCKKVSPSPIRVRDGKYEDELWYLVHVCPKHGKIATSGSETEEDAIREWNEEMEEA